jgi:hypothetical protein
VDIWFDRTASAVKWKSTAFGSVDQAFTTSNTLETWRGTASLSVTVLYDQSGNSQNATGIGSTIPTLITTSSPYIQLSGTSTTAGGYFNIGSTTWALATYGFSSFVKVNLQSANSWERVYDFGNGGPNNNIFLSRNGTTDDLYFEIWTGTTTRAIANTTVTQSNDWLLAVHNVTPISLTQGMHTTRLNKASAGSTFTGTVSDRTLLNSWIGRSNWDRDQYANMQIKELLFFDRVASTDTMTGWESTLL